jgi:hypothetical protein
LREWRGKRKSFALPEKTPENKPFGVKNKLSSKYLKVYDKDLSGDSEKSNFKLNGCTTGFNLRDPAFCPHSVVVCVL